MGRGVVCIPDTKDARISFPVGTIIESRRHNTEAGQYEFDVSHPDLPSIPGYPKVTTDGEGWKLL
jgi:hypothetical protein